MIPRQNIDAEENHNFITFGVVNIFKYKNWRGEIRMRKVIPMCIRFNTSGIDCPSSNEPKLYAMEWVIEALDVEKNEYRTFALSNIEPR